MESRYQPMKVRVGSVDRTNAQQAVFGRDALADRLWHELRRMSLQVLSERRMGKTWLLHLAQARQPDDFFSIFLNVEDLKSAEEFSQRLLESVYREVPASDRVDAAKGALRARWGHWRGKEVGAYKVPDVGHWKGALRDSMLAFQARIGERLPVLILDELPHLLDSIIAEGNAPEAVELLDTLRALRQAMPKLRMVFCGSLGFHIVFEKLRKAGYSGQPVNDMGAFEVPPLDATTATLLAGNFLLGEEVPCDDLDGVAQAVGDAASRVPFYLQHLAQWMARHTDQPWTAEAVQVALAGIYDDAGDPLQFRYFDHRLVQYYPPEWVENARVALDILSRTAEGCAVGDLLNQINHVPRALGMTHDGLMDLLDTLRDDHYLVRRDGVHRFKLEIVRRWWLATRGRAES